MITTDPSIAQSDCLFYVIPADPAERQGASGAAPQGSP